MLIAGRTIKQVSNLFHMPASTVSWHLIYPLKDIDYFLWRKVRTRLDKYAKNKSRVINHE